MSTTLVTSPPVAAGGQESSSNGSSTALTSRRPRRRRMGIMAAVVLAAVLSLFTALAGPASAAPYPSADVQVGANVRPCASTTKCGSYGTVAQDAPPQNTQRSWVSCYRDGDYATGNYYTNRWFFVYVTVSGNPNAFWGYVHASYVYNQPTVGTC